MKTLISITVVISFIINGLPINAMEYSHLAVPGMVEMLGARDENVLKTALESREKLSSNDTIEKALLMLEQMIKTYSTIQNTWKHMIFSRIFGGLDQKIAMKLGDVILALKPEEQVIILDVFRRKILDLRRKRGYKEDITYRILVQVYKMVKNFPLRRRIAQAAGSTSAPMPVGDIAVMAKAVTTVSMYVPFMTSHLKLVSETAKKLWESREYRSALIVDAEFRGRLAYVADYVAKNHGEDSEVKRILFEGHRAQDLRRNIHLERSGGKPSVITLGSDLWEQIGNEKERFEWGMHRKVFERGVRRQEGKLHVHVSLSADEEFHDLMIARFSIEGLKLVWPNQSLFEILNQVQKEGDKRAREEQKERIKQQDENKNTFWLDNIIYDEALDELRRADEYSYEFWYSFVLRMNLEIDKQASIAIETAQ